MKYSLIHTSGVYSSEIISPDITFKNAKRYIKRLFKGAGIKGKCSLYIQLGDSVEQLIIKL